MSQLPAGPWEWREVAGRFILWSAVGRREVVLDADIRLHTACPVLRVRDEKGLLVSITPDHPVARLLAAAPDLLEALKETVNGLTYDLSGEENHRILGIINAAIDKAEGRV